MSLTPYVHLDGGILDDAPGGAILPLPTQAREHLERVLRLQAGATLVVADGQGREAAALLGVGTVVIDGPVVEHAAPTTDIHLVQAIAKGRKTDQIVRSATELGVDRVSIVVSQRSVTKPDTSKRDRMAVRWSEIARAAGEQSRRPRLPRIDGPWPLDEFLLANGTPAVGIIGEPSADSGLRDVLALLEPKPGQPLVVAVGPEGGWSDQEVTSLTTVGLTPARLGSTVLRTEHAGHALCAIVAFHLGRMD